jgi:hypothetical protein
LAVYYGSCGNGKGGFGVCGVGYPAIVVLGGEKKLVYDIGAIHSSLIETPRSYPHIIRKNDLPVPAT